jgi:hypothetical protein
MVNDLEALSRCLTGAAAAHDKMMVDGLVDLIKSKRTEIEETLDRGESAIIEYKGMRFKVSHKGNKV